MTTRRPIPAVPTDRLPWVLAPLIPEERQAMAHICENASILDAGDTEHTYLIVPVTPTVLDTLAAFGADGEDCENDLEDEAQPDDEDRFRGGYIPAAL